MNDKIDKALRDKLHGYSEQPAPSVWERIERDLAAAGPVAPAPRRTLWPRVLRFGAAAALLAAIAGTVLWFQPGQTPQTAQGPVLQPADSVSTVQPALASTGVPAMPAFSDTPAVPSSLLRAPSVRTAGHAAPTDDTARIVICVAPPADLPQSGMPVTQPDKPTDTQPPLHNESAAGPSSRTPQSAPWSTDPGRHSYYNPMRKGNFNRHNPRRVAAMLYAANTGGGGSNSPASTMPAQNYRITEVVTRGSGNATTLTATPQLKSADHRLPLSFGAGVSFGLTPRLSLETGLTYTYLRSDFEYSGTMNEYSERQDLHYVGVPVAVLFRVADLNALSFYVRGGGMLEKGVSGQRQKTVGSAAPEPVVDFTIKGVQPSLSASAGIELRLGQTVGLYAEPGLNYYPSIENQPLSYRTENKASFGLRAGLRINLH